MTDAGGVHVSKPRPGAGAAVMPEPEPDLPDVVVITVTLANARKIGSRARWPGDVVTLPADEARDLIREGHAVRA